MNKIRLDSILGANSSPSEIHESCRVFLAHMHPLINVAWCVHFISSSHQMLTELIHDLLRILAELPPSVLEIEVETDELGKMSFNELRELSKYAPKRRRHVFRSIDLSRWKGVATCSLRSLGLAVGSDIEVVRGFFITIDIETTMQETKNTALAESRVHFVQDHLQYSGAPDFGRILEGLACDHSMPIYINTALSNRPFQAVNYRM